MKSLNCKWMGIDLKSPFILASLTLFSKPNVEKHVEYFSNAANYGVGAIVLPSIHPLRSDESVGSPHVRVAAIPSGLGQENEYMGFAVLGTTDNIVSVAYGLSLAQEAVKINVPIIASIANIGTKKEYLDTIRKLISVDGLSGIELNYSCPSVLNGLPVDNNLLREVRELCGTLPISVKLAPNVGYSEFIQNDVLINGITYSNAYSGLMPPALNIESMTPFGDGEFWRPTGIYGPQEKVLTFNDIWKFKMDQNTSHIDLSSVGGYVSPQDAIQALMLGANTVQLSSAVFWKGLKIIQDCNHKLSDFLDEHGLTLSMLKGISLNHIKNSDSDLSYERPIRVMTVDAKKCRCNSCSCVERGCYALKKPNGLPAEIDPDLCSGCGWCKISCVKNAIQISS